MLLQASPALALSSPPLHSPDKQLLQAPAPGCALCLPAAHAAHGPPSGPVEPALHVQFVEAVLPSGELDLAAHAVHASLPDAALYLPDTHAEHAPPSGPSYPGLQVQAVSAALPAAELEFSGQDEHALAPAPEKVPAPHSSHSAIPSPAVCLPATHTSHPPPSSCP